MTDIVETILSEKEMPIKIVCSSPLKGEYKKVVLRKIEGERFTLERYTENKTYSESVPPKDFEKCLKTHVIGDFKQVDVFYAYGTITVLTNKKGTCTVRRSKAQTLSEAVHNRKKKYILQEGEDIPAMKDLGIFTKENKISSAMQDKFRQINRFIQTVDEEFRSPPETLTILDFGCGKSYLTFLLYYYFTFKKSVKTRIIGYDLKEDVVEKCNLTARKYGYDGLTFIRADVGKDELTGEKIDMVITLHACDTATDFALDFAVKRGVKYIFSVPCCQKEINEQIRRGGDYDIFLKHGLIKERFSALLTDAVRAEVLENAGYRVDCLEFVGIDASPKNLMIRAVKSGAPPDENGEIKELLRKYGVRQTLLEFSDKHDKQEVKNG